MDDQFGNFNQQFVLNNQNNNQNQHGNGFNGFGFFYQYMHPIKNEKTKLQKQDRTDNERRK